MTAVRQVDVLVVGAGPAGLAAAARLATAGAGRVEVLERETRPGGVPRHCAHGGFGTWTRPLTGPRYAHLLAVAAERAGALIRTRTTVLDWEVAAVPGANTLLTVGPGGPEALGARAVVLATGARERPRAARLVPGTRPAGVYTTGELQQAVHLFGQRIGTRAVVVGARDVSYAAARTVRTAGAEVVALVTEHPRARTSPARARSARLVQGIPLLTGTTVTELFGHERLSGVRVRHRDGRTAVLPCDTVVFTGDFVPDHELARRGALDLDPGTRGPTVHTALHTSRPGVFAAGNLLHAVEPAGTAAREGARAAGAVLGHLAGAPWPRPGIPVTVESPLRWITPNRLTPDLLTPGRVDPNGPGPDRRNPAAAPPPPHLLRIDAPLPRPVLYVHQDGRLLYRARLGVRTAQPHRTLTLGVSWHGRVDPEGGEVRVSAG
ncbi:FAD-dependent oxidoreductase [Streptomyces sp. CMSTAAHL-2]|uniref:NAD(P)/FAD-dependent oxidoreductase n=1 Tax=Streptomyces sp. CMSTAAHL-2 TaxID=2904522 RepID=UPI001E37DBC2|nr:FAD-dependent oxidoreductase [Streptomyces sp. CMSTAAHL-2]MCE3035839.1 FAD-dependent oxidoreductase [Streptomyces sp. CMSTAAHL-2]